MAKKTISLDQLDLDRHKKKPILKVIREFCVECMGGVQRGINGPAGCNTPTCALYPYRLGNNPFHGRD